MSYVTVHQEPTSIELSATSEILDISSVIKSLQIKPTIYPSTANYKTGITWTSSNNDVAVVDSNGFVTGISNGEVTITATTENGRAATWKVVVISTPLEISLDSENLVLDINGVNTHQYATTIYPSTANASIGLRWEIESSSSPNVISISSNGVVTGLSNGTATVRVTTENNKTATCNVTIAAVGMTIAEAKAAVQRDGLQSHIGDLVEYNPTAGGTWRIFYYDEAGDFGTAGKLYLKRDFVSNDTTLSSYTSYTPTTQGLAIMKAMNPKWRDSSYSSIDKENEHCVAWLCDPTNWTSYKTAEADYAIGSPSVEMYMKAYNVWKTGNKDATNLICKVESANGYSVGANGTYANSGYYTKNNTIEAGPNKIFMTASSGKNWWLASPSSRNDDRVLLVYGIGAGVGNYDYSYMLGVCPVVSL